MEPGDFSILETDDLSVPYTDINGGQLHSQLSANPKPTTSAKRKYESSSSNSDNSDDNSENNDKIAVSGDGSNPLSNDVNVQHNVDINSVSDSANPVARKDEDVVKTNENDKRSSSDTTESERSFLSQESLWSPDSDDDNDNSNDTTHHFGQGYDFIDCSGNTKFHMLTKYGEKNELLRFLDVCPDEILHNLINRKNSHGQTVLHIAALHSDAKKIENLIYAGADPGIQYTLSNGRTILHILVESGTAETLRYLAAMPELKDVHVEYSGKPIKLTEIPNYDGMTAFHEAVINNNIDMTVFLLSIGASTGTADRKSGRTALHFAGNLMYICYSQSVKSAFS